MNIDIKDTLIKSTASNYLLLIIKIITSLFLVRIIFLGISNEEYGFWALLWSIFGYSVLLDFGFGTAVQKATSETLANKKWKNYNKLISTIFFSYVVLAFGILILTVSLAFNLENLFTFSDTKSIESFQMVFLIFGVGTTLIFPLGFFREILRGLQEIPLRNNIDLFFLILNFIVITLAIYLYSSLLIMAIGAILVQLLTNICMAYYVYKKVPSLQISLELFQKEKVKEVMGFSLFAYIVMFSNLIIFKTDQIVISMFSSIALVGFYQIISRVSELFRQFSTQIHDIVGPLSASFFAASNHNKLSSVLLQSNQVVAFVATMLLVPSFLFIEELLNLWLNITNVQVITTAKILLFSMYILVVLRSSSVQVLLMCNKHKQLTLIAIIESIMNLGLSIYLIGQYSIVGVAIGTLIPNVLLAFLYNIPVACKFSNISIYLYFKAVLFKNILIGLCVYAILFFISQYIAYISFLILLLFGFSSVVLYCLFYFFLCLDKEQREKVKSLSKKYILNKKKLLNIINV